MIRPCLFLLAGFYAPQLSSFDPDSDLILTALVAAIAALCLRVLRLATWSFIGFAFFIVAASDVIDSRLATDYVGDSIVVDVLVVDFPRAGEHGVALIVVPETDTRLPPRVRVSWHQPPVEVRLGDRWQLELRLRRPRGSANPGGFDYEGWLFREGIGAVGYVVNSHRNHLRESGPSRRLDRIRQGFVDRVVSVVDDADAAAVLAAIVVGARHLLSPAQWERFAQSGTSHLMAISGLHVGLAASGGYLLASLLLGGLRLAQNQHRAAVVTGLLVACLYAVASGMAIPARRAILMLGIVAIALLRGRRPIPARAVATSCMLLAAFAPLATMAPGFALSFSAVVVLLWLARRRVHALPPTNSPSARFGRGVLALGNLQVALLLGLLPLTALLFGRVAVMAPALNLLAVPVFSVVTVPSALLGLVLDGPLLTAGDALLAVAAGSIGLLESVIGAATRPGWTTLTVPIIEDAAWVLVFLPVCWVLLPSGWPCRALAWFATAALALHVPGPPAAGCIEARILDVGQGLAVLVRTRTTTLLYDTGPVYRSGNNAAQSVILPFLRRLRVTRLENLVVTHGDNDHAGGVSTLLDALPVANVLVGERLVDIARKQRRCHSGIAWQVDGVRFAFLHPQPATDLRGNDASCVLLVAAGNHRLLLTGDIERLAEARLVARGLPAPIVAVSVPHHGSSTSSTPAFVAAVRAGIAIVANAHGNRWGFPKPEVASRWRAAGAQLLQTAEAGAITVAFCSNSDAVRVQRQREARHRIWHE